MEYLHVKNLEKYHPGYKDRNLQWCKTYFTMLNADPEFEMLCEIDKWRLVSFIMLELQIKKPVPLDEEYLKRKGFNPKKRRISLSVRMLHNFVTTENEENILCSVDKDKEEDKEKSKRAFTPPTIEEVSEYIKSKNITINAEKFWHYYEARGWKYKGNQAMKSWKSAVVTWKGNENKYGNGQNKKPTAAAKAADREMPYGGKEEPLPLL